VSDIGKGPVNSVSSDNVVQLRPRPSRATYCQDCDPEGLHPFRVEVRADPRTCDILTPCPACGRHALAEVRAVPGHRKQRG
jgi:hypothetical protein